MDDDALGEHGSEELPERLLELARLTRDPTILDGQPMHVNAERTRSRGQTRERVRRHLAILQAADEAADAVAVSKLEEIAAEVPLVQGGAVEGGAAPAGRDRKAERPGARARKGHPSNLDRVRLGRERGHRGEGSHGGAVPPPRALRGTIWHTMAHDLTALIARARSTRDILAPAQKAGAYDHINFRPPEAVREALRRGIELHEQGYSGDGLKPETVAWARRLAAGEAISPEKARAMRAWLARHAVDRRPDWATDKTPGYVAWLLWGGDAAEGWSDKLVRQMEAADAKKSGAGLESLIDLGRRVMAQLTGRAETQKDAVTTADLGPGVAPPQVGADPRAKFKPGVREERPVVVGQIAPEASAPATKDETAPAPADELPPRLVDFGGLPVLVDRPKGFVQHKFDDAGQLLWSRTYVNDYGYLAGTNGGDGEGLDVFLGPDPAAPIAFWAVQNTGDPFDFDEYKVLLGFADESAARVCYLAHIPEKYLTSLTPIPVDRIKALLGLPGNDDFTTELKSAPSATKRSRLTRCAKAIASATKYTGATIPIEQAPDELRAQIASAPLSWTYANPDAVGGWLGAIEPSDEGWIAFVAVDGKVLAWASRDEAGGVRGDPFLAWRPDLAARADLVASTKAANADEQFILGIVLVPEKVDLQREIYAHEVVRKTAHDFLAFFRNTDLQHKVFINEAVELVESYLAPMDMWFTRDGTAYPTDPATGGPYRAPEGARFVKKGSWLLAHRVKDAALWAEIKAGKYTGYSINGLSKKVPLRPAA